MNSLLQSHVVQSAFELRSWFGGGVGRSCRDGELRSFAESRYWLMIFLSLVELACTLSSLCPLKFLLAEKEKKRKSALMVRRSVGVWYQTGIILMSLQPNGWVKRNLVVWLAPRSTSYRPIDFPAKLKKVDRVRALFACANSRRVRRCAFFPAATSTTQSASINGSRYYTFFPFFFSAPLFMHRLLTWFIIYCPAVEPHVPHLPWRCFRVLSQSRVSSNVDSTHSSLAVITSTS